MVSNYYVAPGGALNGKAFLSGDKSISHRALLFAAIAEGTSYISGLLKGADCLATLHALELMGVNIALAEDKTIVSGVGLRGFNKPFEPLDMGNSGTAMRLLAGILVGQNFSSQLIGDASLTKRPMERIITPLTKMGAMITANSGFPPLHIVGNSELTAIQYALPVASAQVKSCLLLAGLYAKGTTHIIEKTQTRDHSERLLQVFGVELKKTTMGLFLAGEQSLKGREISIPGDISSAAFFLVGATIAKGSDIELINVGINPTRIGIIKLLKAMGADITIYKQRYLQNEPVANIRVRAALKLKGIKIPASQVPFAIDEFPALFIAAACAEGITYLAGAKELRVKESDRIAVMAAGLKDLGIKVKVLEDGLVIEGGQIKGGTVASFGDHRIAMAFAIAGLVAKEPILVKDCENVITSFPDFLPLAQQLGLNIRMQNL